VSHSIARRYCVAWDIKLTLDQSFFWLAEYKSRGDPRAEWYFEAHFLSVVLDVLHAIRSVVAKYITR
jgi:hypothetical protein